MYIYRKRLTQVDAKRAMSFFVCIRIVARPRGGYTYSIHIAIDKPLPPPHARIRVYICVCVWLLLNVYRCAGIRVSRRKICAAAAVLCDAYRYSAAGIDLRFDRVLYFEDVRDEVMSGGWGKMRDYNWRGSLGCKCVGLLLNLKVGRERERERDDEWN